MEASKVSKSPKRVINSAAILIPIPGTPGMLSLASPARAMTSLILSGVTPNRSSTVSLLITRFFTGSRNQILFVINCIRSLSEEYISVLQPLIRASRV